MCKFDESTVKFDTVKFDAEEFDDAAEFSAETFTTPETGRYPLIAWVRILHD
ncbi:hypothetical protein LCGC14_2400090 [marine sediment metagenome]|uniref:Uncharacterized protein n=1 Tax=marine sediment metagenome TaxID=412755 RepID=A0A0F9BVP9_9ZZZZ